MKRNITIIAIFSFLFCSTFLYVRAENKKSTNVSVASFLEGGKWVPEYGGAATPFRCYCISALLKYQCRIGDISSDLSLCE